MVELGRTGNLTEGLNRGLVSQSPPNRDIAKRLQVVLRGAGLTQRGGRQIITTGFVVETHVDISEGRVGLTAVISRELRGSGAAASAGFLQAQLTTTRYNLRSPRFGTDSL